MFFKKVDEPYMKAKSKKDTIFAKSFIVLDHREKYHLAYIEFVQHANKCKLRSSCITNSLGKYLASKLRTYCSELIDSGSTLGSSQAYSGRRLDFSDTFARQYSAWFDHSM
jgi:hypothetical protein